MNLAAALHEYGIYVSVLNPLYSKQSGGGPIRKVKTEKADAMKIAKYVLDSWVGLRECTLYGSRKAATEAVQPPVQPLHENDRSAAKQDKRGSPHPQKALFQVVSTCLRKAQTDEPVYRFLDKKRSEGTPYFVYLTAAQNKFPRIYYTRVKGCLAAQDSFTIQN
jgi:hypothetical protein